VPSQAFETQTTIYFTMEALLDKLAVQAGLQLYEVDSDASLVIQSVYWKQM
jgi:hypothetical protein